MMALKKGPVDPGITRGGGEGEAALWVQACHTSTVVIMPEQQVLMKW
jgi:hypothetical protein